MKVIQKGRKPEDRLHRGTCRRCDALVEFRRSEGRVVYDQRDGDYLTVKCPCCGSDINTSLHPTWADFQG